MPELKQPLSCILLHSAYCVSIVTKQMQAIEQALKLKIIYFEM
jgi:hypothetical protein